MTLRDKLYFRFGLLHQRYGRMWAALVEGVCIAVAAAVIGLAVLALANLTMWWYEQVMDDYARVYKQEAEGYKTTLLACLNGGVIGKAGEEFVACEGAVTFRMGGVR